VAQLLAGGPNLAHNLRCLFEFNLHQNTMNTLKARSTFRPSARCRRSLCSLFACIHVHVDTHKHTHTHIHRIYAYTWMAVCKHIGEMFAQFVWGGLCVTGG